MLASCHEQPPPPGPGGHQDPAAGPMRLWTFEDDASGTIPSGWSVAETNGDGTPARWAVTEMEDAQQGERFLRLVESHNSGSTFNMLLTDDTFPAYLQLAVWLRADSGKEDRGGGLVWRVQDADNYWVTRWNPSEKNLRLYVVENSVRRQLASVEIEADPAAWHELRVIARGSLVIVHFDGKERLRATDSVLPLGGRIGLWTKADAATSFDSLTFALVAPPQGDIPGPQPR